MHDPLSPEFTNPRLLEIQGCFRAVLRAIFWFIFSAICFVALMLNFSLNCSPKAFTNLHQTQGWIPLDSLTDEAKSFAIAHLHEPAYYHSVKLAQSKERRYYEWPDPWNLFSAYLLHLTLDSDRIVELNLSRETTISPIKNEVEIETLFQALPGLHFYKHRTLKRMLEAGTITPPRYRELKGYLDENFPNHISIRHYGR